MKTEKKTQFFNDQDKIVHIMIMLVRTVLICVHNGFIVCLFL